MATKQENRQCLICEQMIPAEQKAVPIPLRPENRIIHEGCAKRVSEAYKLFVINREGHSQR